ncbi:peptidase A4 family-domain-containing protein [Phyllosticta citrichinensis]|uniref:Peptidase A4 family-domain-containing protein n=1 Tax=Phyllosticta citrichinensis TaxID=1130410 RepID=A0ABR1XTW3_9PEZI
MHFTAAFAAAVLSATTVLAAPQPMGHGLEARMAARRGANLKHISQPIKKNGKTAQIAGVNATVNAPTKTEVEYSSNWAGAVIEEPPSGTFTAVSGKFTVPTPGVPSGSSGAGEYAASAWVGIDGDTYGNAILQTGVDFYATSSGSYSFDAWYEWYPDYAYNFNGIDISAGDVITVTVESSSSSAGTAVVENETTGQRVSKSLTAPESSATLGGQNAEWIVEDFESNGSLVAFADFGSVTFTDATAETSSGGSYGPSDGSIIDIEQGSTVLTSVSVGSGEVTVTYTG